MTRSIPSITLAEARRVIREHEKRQARPADDPRLRRAEAAYRKAHARAEELRLARNEAILAALADGLSQGDVSRISGLGHQRVSQIVKAAQNEAPARGNAGGTTTRGADPHAASGS